MARKGWGVPYQNTPMTRTALAAVEPTRAGMAGGVLNALRQVGNTAGVALFGSSLASHVGHRTGAMSADGFVTGLRADLASAGGALVVAGVVSLVALRLHGARASGGGTA
jgi:hypothetical protein